MADTFTLGGPLLKTPHAPAHLPEQWRADLLRALSAPDRNRFALASSVALDWLLREWPDATLTVPVKAKAEERRKAGADERSQAPARRLLCAALDLAERGSRSTTLVLREQGSIPEGEAWWDQYLPALSTVEFLPTLALQLSFQRIPAQLLALVGPAFQGLQSLTLGPRREGELCSVQFPPPTALPTLRHLILGRSHAYVWPTVGPYLPQLVTLVIMWQRFDWEAGDLPGWQSIFQPQYRTHRLRRLSVPDGRRADLLTRLMTCAPYLAELTLSEGARCPLGAIPQTAHPWSRLRLGDGRLCAATDLWWLPLPAEGPLVVEAIQPGCLSIYLPLTEQEASKLQRLTFQGFAELYCRNGSHPRNSFTRAPAPPHEQPQALSRALSHISQLQPSQLPVHLVNFTMTPALATTLSAAYTDGWCNLSLSRVHWPADIPPTLSPALPPLQKLQISGTLDDTRLAQVLGWVQSVGTVEVKDVKLQGAVPQGTVVPWRTLDVHHSEITTLLRHMALLGGDACFCVKNLAVCLPSKVDNGVYERLAEQLGRLRFTKVYHVFVRPADGLSETDEPRVLRASLKLVQDLPCKDVHVVGWAASDANMQQLQHLPQWDSLVYYQRPGSTPSPTALTHAASVIPASFIKLMVDVGGHTQPQVEAFLRALPTDRTADQPLEVSLYNQRSWGQLFEGSAVSGEELQAVLTAAMDSEDSHPHVTITTGNQPESEAEHLGHYHLLLAF